MYIIQAASAWHVKQQTRRLTDHGFENSGWHKLKVNLSLHTPLRNQREQGNTNVHTEFFSLYLFFPAMPPHVHIDFMVPPPGCGRSVTDFWVWSADRAQLRCPDDVSDYDMRGVPGGTLNLNSTGYPNHGHYGDLPLQGKIPSAEPGIELGTSWLVVRSSEHQTHEAGLGNLCWILKIMLQKIM
jgi:hypothetical protein